MTETRTEPVGLPAGAVVPDTALVTGANRGLGAEVVRQLAGLGTTVFLGSRDRARGEEAARSMEGDVHVVVGIRAWF